MPVVTTGTKAGTTVMSACGALPPELCNALSSSRGYIVVIEGDPGTGKSLLAQEILRLYEKSFLVLTDTENVMDAQEKMACRLDNWKERHLVAKQCYSTKGATSFGPTFQELITKLVGFEAQIENYDIIVVDSWSRLVESMDVDQTKEIQRMLIRAARDEAKKLVLITEKERNRQDILQLLHSADAIISLRREHDEERMYRQLMIEKLRSMPIQQDTYLFTLDHGYFTCIPYYVHQYPAITVEREPIEDPSPDRISTGNGSLDVFTKGGFMKGTLSLIEVENLAAPYLDAIYIPFLSNHLQLGRPALIVLPEGWSPERLTSGLSRFIDPDRVDKQVVFFGRQAMGKKKNVKSIDNDPWKTLQEIRYEANQLEAQFGLKATQLFALDTLENKYSAGVVREMMAELTAALPSTNRVTLTILSRQQSINSESISSSTHIRVLELCGVLNLYGVNPRTGYFAVRPILSGGFLDYDLLPVV